MLKDANKDGQEDVDLANEYASADENRNLLNYKAKRYIVTGKSDKTNSTSSIENQLCGGKVKASKMKVERRKNDPHLFPERNNLAERQRIACEQARSLTTKQLDAGSFTHTQEQERFALNEAGRAKNEQVKEDWNWNIDPVADIWRRQGVDEQLLDDTHAIHNDDNRRYAIAVMGWTQRGLKTKDGESVVPTTMIREHGAEYTVHLMKKASDLLVREGKLDPKEAKARLDEMVSQVEDTAKRWKADEAAVFDNATATFDDEVKQATRGMSEKQKAGYRKKIVDAVREMSNSELLGYVKAKPSGQIDSEKIKNAKSHYALLMSLFGTEERVAKVTDHFYKEKKSDIASGQDAIDNLNRDMAGNFGDEGGNGDNVEAHERIINEGSPTAEVVEKSFYVPSKEEHGYFDVEDEGQAAHLQNSLAYRGRSLTEQIEREYKWAKDNGRADKLESVRKQIELLKTHSDTTRVKSEEVGYIDHMLDKAAKKKGSDLTKEEVASIEDKILAKHYGFAGVEESATNAEKSDNADERKHLLSHLNNKYRTIKVTHSSFGENHIEFDKEDLGTGVTGIRLKEPNMLSEAVHAKRGAIIIERKSGRPFVTTSGQILRKVFQAADNSFEDTKVHMNDIQSRYDLLKQGITSVLSGLDDATGRIGFIYSHLDGGNPNWMNPSDVTAHLPDELPLGEVNGVRVTVGDARTATRQQERNAITNRYSIHKLDNIAIELSIPHPRRMRAELLKALNARLENPAGLSPEQFNKLSDFKERVADHKYEPEYAKLKEAFMRFVPHNNAFKKEVLAKAKAAVDFLENGALDSMISFYEVAIGYNTAKNFEVRQSIKAGRRESGRKARERVKANIRETLNKGGTLTGLSENQIAGAVQEVLNFVREMSVRGVASISEKARDTRSNSDTIVPSEHKPHGGKAVKTEEEVVPNTTLREDRAETIGNSRSSYINRNAEDRGFESGVLASVGMAGSESTVRGKAESKEGGTINETTVEKSTGPDFSARNVIDGLMCSVGYVVDAARKVSKQSRLADLVDTLKNITKMDALQLMKLDGSLTHEGAIRIKARAENALSRIKAFQNELLERRVGDGTQGEVVSIDSEDVRSSDVVPGTAVGSAAVDRARNVAGSVRRDEGVAEGAAAGDIRVATESQTISMRFAKATPLAPLGNLARRMAQ